jgi:hypothetical protein
MTRPASKSAVRGADTVRSGGHIATLDSAPVRMLDLNEGLKRYLAATVPPTSLSAGTLAETIRTIETAKQMETAGRVVQGWQLASIKSMGAEAFTVVCARCRIPRSSAYELMDLFAQYQRLQDLEAIQGLVDMGAKKALALKQWSDDELATLARGDEARGLTYERAMEMSPEQLRAWKSAEQQSHIDALEAKNKALELRLETERKHQHTRARLGEALMAEADLPHGALVVRQESIVLSAQIELAIHSLEAIAKTHLITRLSSNPVEQLHQGSAAKTLYINLAAVCGRALDLLADVARNFPEDVKGPLQHEHLLTAAEIRLYAQQREAQYERHKAAEKLRDDDRENNRPGKRGAKRK